MKRIRYLSLLVMLLFSITTWGQEFNPTDPAEPGAAPRNLTLKALPADGGFVYGAGRYLPETTVGLRVSPVEGYVFEKWTDVQGNTVSSAGSFNFVKGHGDETLTAHFKFAPSPPVEPADPLLLQYFRLTLAAEKGGTVSGGGRYQSNAKVSLNASCEEGYVFVDWTNMAGDTVSSVSSFKYTVTAANETLTAHFKFSPSSPSEPTDPVLRHNVKVSTEDGGTVSTTATRLLEGTSCTVKATANEGYRFQGWYVADTLYTSLQQFSYTMEKKDIHFVARFEFDPYNPSEPQMPEDKKHAFYMMTVIGKPGDILDIPLYITNIDTLCDMSFQLTFPLDFELNLQSLEINERVKEYSVSYTAINDTSYLFSFLGGTLLPGDTELMRFNVTIPEDCSTGVSKRVKINQVSVCEMDGVRITASTRNGRIAVYKRGDTNGDNLVNVTDVMNMISFVLEEEIEVFIREVSDMNDDNDFNVTDALGIATVLLEE